MFLKRSVHTLNILFYIIISISCILIAPSRSYSAWTPQSIPTTNTLYAVYFVDANVGYAVGEAGIVIKTINGGADSWTAPVANIGGSALNTVYFVDVNNGWAGGDGGIFRTINGGTSWMFVNPPGIISVHHIVFTPDGSRGFAGDNDGDLYWSIDAGVTWSLHPITFSGNPSVNIEFVDNNNGFMVTESGEFYATTDGGVNWTARADLPNQLNNVSDSSWVDPLHGWVVGGGARELAYTTDGGNSWTLGPNVVSFDYNGVHFIDTLNGFVVDDSGNIRQTTDGGLTWTIVASAGSELFDIFIAPNGKIYTVGDPDFIYTETPLILNIVKQAWEVGGAAPLPSPVTAPSGARIVFLIYVKNPGASTANDVAFTDSLDTTAFDYIPGSIYKDDNTLSDAATDLQIFNSTKPPARGGNGVSQTDASGVGDNASACTGIVTCPGTGADLVTFGASSTQGNLTLNAPANSTVAFRFEVMIK